MKRGQLFLTLNGRRGQWVEEAREESKATRRVRTEEAGESREGDGGDGRRRGRGRWEND